MKRWTGCCALCSLELSWSCRFNERRSHNVGLSFSPPLTSHSQGIIVLVRLHFSLCYRSHSSDSLISFRLNMFDTICIDSIQLKRPTSFLSTWLYLAVCWCLLLIMCVLRTHDGSPEVFRQSTASSQTVEGFQTCEAPALGPKAVETGVTDSTDDIAIFYFKHLNRTGVKTLTGRKRGKWEWFYLCLVWNFICIHVPEHKCQQDIKARK